MRFNTASKGNILPILLLSACSVFLGSPYQRQQAIPNGMGAVYIYAANDIDTLQKVYVDRDVTTPAATYSLSMVDKGYFTDLMGGGPVRVITSAKEGAVCVEFPVIPGTHHYVRISGTDEAAARVQVVAMSTAETEISSKRKMSTESKSKTSEPFNVECVKAEAF